MTNTTLRTAYSNQVDLRGSGFIAKRVPVRIPRPARMKTVAASGAVSFSKEAEWQNSANGSGKFRGLTSVGVEGDPGAGKVWTNLEEYPG